MYLVEANNTPDICNLQQGEEISFDADPMHLMIAGVPGVTLGGSNVYSDPILTSTVDGEKIKHRLSTGSMLYVGNEETPMVVVFFEGKKTLQSQSTGDGKSWIVTE